MASEIRVGKWRLTISDPSPLWVTLSHDEAVSIDDEHGDGLRGMTHRDLADLQYAASKALRLAREALGKAYEHELT